MIPTARGGGGGTEFGGLLALDVEAFKSNGERGIRVAPGPDNNTHVYVLC